MVVKKFVRINYANDVGFGFNENHLIVYIANII